MATVVKTVYDPRAAVMVAQELSDIIGVSLTSIVLTYTPNEGKGIITYNNASTSSRDTLKTHNRVILDAAAADLDTHDAGGAGTK